MKKIISLFLVVLTAFSLTACAEELSAEEQSRLDEYAIAAVEYYNKKYDDTQEIKETYYGKSLTVGTDGIKTEYDFGYGFYKMKNGDVVRYDYNKELFADNIQAEAIENAMEKYIQQKVWDNKINLSANEIEIDIDSVDNLYADKKLTNEDDIIAFVKYLREFNETETLSGKITIAANTDKSIDRKNVEAINLIIKETNFFDERHVITEKVFKDNTFYGCEIVNGEYRDLGYFHELNIDGIEVKLMLKHNENWNNSYYFTPADIIIEKTDLTAEELQELYREMYTKELNKVIEKITGKKLEYKLFDVNGVVYRIKLSDQLSKFLSDNYSDGIDVKILETNKTNADIVNFSKSNKKLYNETYLFVGDYKVGEITVSNKEQMTADVVETSLKAFEGMIKGATRAGEYVVAALEDLKQKI